MNALFNLERQREDVRNCMYQMSVWNTFNPNIVKRLFTGTHSKSPNKKTINELVRLGAKREHIRKRASVGSRRYNKSSLASSISRPTTQMQVYRSMQEFL